MSTEDGAAVRPHLHSPSIPSRLELFNDFMCLSTEARAFFQEWRASEGPQRAALADRYRDVEVRCHALFRAYQDRCEEEASASRHIP